MTTEEKDILTNDEINGKTNSTPVDTTSHATYVEKKADPIDETIYDPIKITEPVDFLGGTQGLMKFIAQNTIYPPSAQEYEIEGTVYVRFAVMKTGAIGNVILLKSSGDPILDNEALRVVKLIPQCTPGKINGNPVSSWFIVPVKFKLLK